MKQKLQLLIPITALLMGMLYFVEPFLSSWFEIVDPVVCRTVFMPIDWAIFAIKLPILRLSENWGVFIFDVAPELIFLLFLFYLFKVIRKQWTGKQRRPALIFIGACCLLCGAMLSLGWTSTARRVNTFRIGGWTRLMWSGGASHVRTEALEFMRETTQADPPKSDWPLSLQKLGYWMRIEHDNQLMLVGLGRVIGMAEEFGFVIQDPNMPTPQPHYLESDEYLRLWKLADGIYFFMT